MNHAQRILGLCCTLAIFATGPAISDTFEEGVAAYDQGDYKKAHDLWQEQVGDDENPAALRNLGHLYRRGLGVERDAEKARDLYEDAARQGLAGAQANLGRMYLRGDGIPQDYGKAYHWLTQAARNNHVAARYRLATMYDYGLGGPANPEAALLWYGLAGKAGHQAALDRMVTLVALMPEPQLENLPSMAEAPALDPNPDPVIDPQADATEVKEAKVPVKAEETPAIPEVVEKPTPEPAILAQAAPAPAPTKTVDAAGVEEPIIEEIFTEEAMARASANEPPTEIIAEQPTLYALEQEKEAEDVKPETEVEETGSGWFRVEAPTLKKRR